MRDEAKTVIRDRPTVKEMQFELRENLILDAANELMVAKGFALITIDDVINLVGISKPTFYLHFRSKEDMVLALAIRTKKEMTAKVRALAEQYPPEEAITQLIEWTVEVRFSPTGLCCYDISGMIHLESDNAILEVSEELMNALAGLLEKAQAGGIAVQGIPPRLLAEFTISILKDWTYSDLLTAGTFSIDTLKSALRRLLMQSA